MKIGNLDIGNLNNSKFLTIEVVTPVHVGGASEKRWIRHIDYFFRDRLIRVIDQQALFNRLVDIPANNHLTGLDIYSDYLLSGKSEKIETYLNKENIALEDISIQTFEYGDKEPEANEIRPVIRNGTGGAYIPGSSIKGAIRSVLFSYLHRTTGKKGYSDELEKTLLGNFDTSIMRYLHPGDATFSPGNTELVDVMLFNLKKRGDTWESILDDRPGFPLCAETFCPKATTTFRLDIASGLTSQYKKIEQTQSRPLLPTYWSDLFPEDQNPFVRLFELINKHSRAHLQRELKFFKKFNQAKHTNLVIDSIEKGLLPETESTNSCLLRLSFGSGFHSITGDYRFEDHTSSVFYPDEKNLTYSPKTRQREPARYKSRRLADNLDMFAPMGFVKLLLPET